MDWCVAAGQPEPEFEEQAGAVVVRFRPSGYHPPLRVGHDLPERQREVLLILSNGERWRFQDILARLSVPPVSRTLRDDLQMLKKLGLIDSEGGRWPLDGGSTPNLGTSGKAEIGGERRRKAALLSEIVIAML